MIINNEGIQSQAVEQCHLCGSRGRVLYSGLRDRLFNAPGVWSLLQCPQCGLVWLKPRPAPADIGKLYSAYYTHGDAGGEPGLQGPLADLGRNVLSYLGNMLHGPIEEASLHSFLSRVLRKVLKACGIYMGAGFYQKRARGGGSWTSAAVTGGTWCKCGAWAGGCRAWNLTRRL